jgi:RimK family alpha-L-glutamate ligase
MIARVGLAAENGSWHRDRLTKALRARGVEPILFSLADVAVVTDGGEPLRIPGFDGQLPDGVLLRTISGGTFEATTLRLGILHALVAASVVVWNSPSAIERCVDKSMTSLLISRCGLPTPDTFVVASRDAAAAIVVREASAQLPLVLKPLFGSQGKGLRLIHTPDDLPAIEEVSRVYYLQRFVPPTGAAWRDYRIFVSGSRVIAGMIREGDAWITNVHQGGRPHPWRMPKEACDIALAAARAVDVSYAGVDLIEEAPGRFLVLEINSMPSWSGLQSVTDIDIAATVVDGFLAAVEVSRGVSSAASS